jgi:general secretion pathway protein K
LPEQSVYRPAVNKKNIAKGSILLIALWSLFLLTTFAVYLGYGIRQKLRLVQRLNERDKQRLITEAGVKKAIAQISKEPPAPYDTLMDAWSNDESAFREIGVGDGTFSVSYNYIDDISGLPQSRFGLCDEERKININKAELAVMARLFQIVLNSGETEAQGLAASIIDWRDSDSELSTPSGSAEDSYYRSERYPYEAKDQNFEVLEELLLVKGMSEDIFLKLKNYITIYGSGKVNINTASKAVLVALGLSEDIADMVLSFRAGEDKIQGTSDDNYFGAPFDIAPNLSQTYHLSDSQIAEISQVVGNFTASSSNFMVRCTVKLHQGKNIAEIVSVINREGKILSWQEP